MADAEVERELALCKCLMKWDALALPDDDMAAALQDMTATGRQQTNPGHNGMRCLLRHTIV